MPLMELVCAKEGEETKAESWQAARQAALAARNRDWQAEAEAGVKFSES